MNSFVAFDRQTDRHSQSVSLMRARARAVTHSKPWALIYNVYTYIRVYSTSLRHPIKSTNRWFVSTSMQKK